MAQKTRFKLKASFLSVLLLIQGLLVCLTVVFTKIIVDSLEKWDVEKTERIAHYVANQIKQNTAIPELAALSVANNQTLAETFAKKNFSKLKEQTDEIWKKLEPQGLSQFSFFLPTDQGIIAFYKAHQPEVHGELISKSRIMVVKCVDEKKLISGLEQGKSGYGFRAVTPIYFKDKFLGCVEFGSKFSEGFLTQLNTFQSGRWTMVNLLKGVKIGDKDDPRIAGINPLQFSGESVLASEDILTQLKQDQIFHQRNKAAETVSLYIPVHNFSGEVALYIQNEFKTDYFAKMANVLWSAGFICFLGLLISGGVILLLYQQITRPIAGLVLETKKIRNFQLDDEVQIPAYLQEIENLVDAVKNMKTGLLSFQKYVPAQLVRQLISSGQEAKIQGHKKELSILFSDIADFTTISEKLSPTELTSQLSSYLNQVTEIIISEKGTVDKYIGDAVMAFWGAPVEDTLHARHACLAALAMAEKVNQMNQKWQAEGRPAFKTRIGVNTGEVVVGNIGSDQRLSYTVIGDSVNLASRLEGINKNYKTTIIISEFTQELVKDEFETRALDTVVVKGKSKGVQIFELVSAKTRNVQNPVDNGNSSNRKVA